MSNNKHRFNPYFIFCVTFSIVGVWFPSYIMLVVWAFVGWSVLMGILYIIGLIMAARILLTMSDWG